MKILFTLTLDLDPNVGGVQRTTFKLGKYFSQNGMEVAYFSLESKGHKSGYHGEIFHAVEDGGAENPDNLKKLEDVLQDFRPDYVINQNPYNDQLRRTLFLNKSRIGFILLGCLRNSLFNFKDNTAQVMERFLNPYLFRLLNHGLGISLINWRHRIKHGRQLKNIIDEHDRFILLAPPNRIELNYFVEDYKKEKVITIPNSIPEVHHDSMSEKENIILHVGRIETHQKRSDLIIPFWEKVHKLLGEDWKFVLVGYGGYYKTLEAEAKQKKLPRFELMGFQEPERFYKRAKFFMMPSAYEGFPNTLLEAQSYACIPFAYNSYKAISWIVEDGVDAILSEPYDTDDMAAQVHRLSKDDYRIEQMQRAALRNAERFTIDNVGKKWIDLFASLKIEFGFPIAKKEE